MFIWLFKLQKYRKKRVKSLFPTLIIVNESKKAVILHD